jgi:SAM-dependent methyltransferase
MIRRHGKPLDVARLKQPVLDDLAAHIAAVSAMAAYLSTRETAQAQETCYICGSARASQFAEIHGFTYVQCDACTHLYTSRRYSEAAIARFYQENDYYARVTYANRETCDYRRDSVARPKVAFAEEFTGAARGRWLDVGSGIGDVVSVAAENGWNATGLELSDTSVAFAREVFGVTLEARTLEAFSAANPALAGDVGVVSFLGVLEHGIDPLRELRLAHRLLKPGGIVLIQVPNGRSGSTLVQKVFPEHVFRHMSPVSHVMLFTERSLLEALSRTGYEPLALWFLGLDVYELVNTLAVINPRMIGSELQHLLIEQFNAFQAVFDRLELGDGLICVARTPDAPRAGA